MGGSERWVKEDIELRRSWPRGVARGGLLGGHLDGLLGRIPSKSAGHGGVAADPPAAAALIQYRAHILPDCVHFDIVDALGGIAVGGVALGGSDP